jgi:hypothetical protein
VQKSDVIEKLARGDQSYDPASISEGSRLHQQQVAIKLDRRKPKRSGRQLADTASDKPENRLRLSILVSSGSEKERISFG